MSVQLESIQFFQPNTASLRIRKNDDTPPMPTPEWTSTGTAGAAAAYVAARAAGTITVLATFRKTGSAISFYVRAQDGSSGGNTLGVIGSTQVTFPAGAPTVTVALDCVRDPMTEVSAHTDVWTWQVRLAATGPWQALATSQQRVYVTLYPPTSPWSEAPGPGEHTPWTDVLEVVCQWASQAQTVLDTADKITRRMFGLGASGGPTPQFAYSGTSKFSKFGSEYYFDCALFLQALAGAPTTPRKVNCCDAASVVSTFANILGCDLKQAQLGGQVFRVNQTILIGKTVFAPLAGFLFHEVAWGASMGAADPVWDGLLQVDSDSKPGKAPRTGVSPINMSFDPTKAGVEYRDRLVLAADLAKAPPIGRPPGQSQNRPLVNQPAVVPPEPPPPPGPGQRRSRRMRTTHSAESYPARFSLHDRVAVLKEQTGFEHWAGSTTLDRSLFLYNFSLAGVAIPGWSQKTRKKDGTGLTHVDSFWLRAGSDADPLARVEAWTLGTRLHAHEHLLLVLLESSLEMPRIETGGAGDIAFGYKDRTVVLSARGNAVILVDSAGSIDEPVLEFARAIDALLISESEPLPVPPPDSHQNAQGSVPLDLPLSNDDGPLWYRLFSKTGDFTVSDGQLLFQPRYAGVHRVAAYSHTVTGSVQRKDLDLVAAKPGLV